jgi:hypothetical protein
MRQSCDGALWIFVRRARYERQGQIVDARQLVQYASHNHKPDLDALIGGSK